MTAPIDPDPFDWDYYNGILHAVYHTDPTEWTWGQYLGYLQRLSDVRLFLAGKNPKAKQAVALGPEEWAAAALRGEIDIATANQPQQIDKDTLAAQEDFLRDAKIERPR